MKEREHSTEKRVQEDEDVGSVTKKKQKITKLGYEYKYGDSKQRNK